MRRLKQFTSQELHISPEQVQIFTPSPSTYSSLMYYTGLDPFSRQPVFVEKDTTQREHQKQIVVDKPTVAEYRRPPHREPSSQPRPTRPSRAKRP